MTGTPTPPQRLDGALARLESTLATLALVAGLAGLAAAGGWLIAGPWGASLALAAAVGSSLAGARVADRYVLHAVRARPVRTGEWPFLWRATAELSRRAGVPTPRLYVFPSDVPNAFTVGRDPATASVALSSGLLLRLDARELAGVLAHELAHVRHRDLLLTSFAATVASMLRSVRRVLGTLLLLALPLVLMVEPRALLLWAVFAIAPVAALLLQAALSRQREFAADREAARLTGDPDGLARALLRIEQRRRSPWALLFGAGGTSQASPWASHPPTAERVARLRALGGASGTGLPRGNAAGARSESDARLRVVPVRIYRGHRRVARPGQFGGRRLVG